MNKNEYFEGDYRRKPSQNLSGLRKSRNIMEFINKVQHDRKKRENDRTEIEKATTIQAVYRGEICRKRIRIELKKKLNSKIYELDQKVKRNIEFSLDDIRYLISHIRFIHSRNFHWNSPIIKNKHDYDNIMYVTNAVSKYKSAIIFAMTEDPDWIWRIVYLLYLLMDLIKPFSFYFDQKIASILQAIKGILDPDVYIEHELSRDTTNVLTVLLDRLLSKGLFKIMITILDKKGSMGQNIYYNIALNQIHDLFKITLRIINSTKNIVFQKTSLKSLAEEVICKEMTADTKRQIFLCFKELEYFPLQNLSDVILNFDDESLYTIHALHNILSYFEEEKVMSSSSEQKKYFLLLSKLTINIPLLGKSLQPNEDTLDSFSYDSEQYFILNDCLNQINTSKRIEKWLIILHGFIKKRDRDGLFWFCKCIYHLWLYDCSSIYKFKLIRKVAFLPCFLTELWDHINIEKRILSFSSQLYSASIMSMLSSGVVITANEADRIMPTLTMFSFILKNHISLLSDELLYEEELFSGESITAFTVSEIVSICNVLKEVVIGIISLAFPSIFMHKVEQRIDVSTPTRSLKFNTLAWRSLLEQIVGLLWLLHDRDSRRPFTKDSTFWLSNTLQECNQLFTQFNRVECMCPFSSEPKYVYRAFNVYENRYLNTIKSLPFTIGFLKRFTFYRNYIAEDKLKFQDPEMHFLQVPYLLLRIRRDYLYEDAFEKISLEPEVRKCIRIHLISSLGIEEQGIDGGGLFREFMMEFFKTAFDPNRGFFILNKNNEFYPNPIIRTICKDFKTHYHFIGKMLGKALYENILVEVPLADFFLAKIMEHLNKIYINGLATVDPDLFKNLISLTCYKGDLAELGLDFTFAFNDFGEDRTVELKHNGRNIQVNEENVLEYVHLVAKFKAHTQIEEQTSSFFDGLGSIIPLEWLGVFTARELQLIISGNKSPIDVNDMKKYTVYSGGYSALHPTIVMFWNVVGSFSDLQKSLFLQFITSYSRPPLLGFKELFPPLCIQLVECDNNRLPSSSTCMNILKLPMFTSEDIMRERLLYAIQSRSGFELI